MDREPAELAREMRRMADLHPQTIWALAMRDGADMIERLVRELSKAQGRVEDLLTEMRGDHD